MRARLAVLAVAGLIAVLGVTAITASGTGHETEVRITAALAADGRIEFALQQREADEGWSERLLPRARFFPATVAAGRWLVSTPLTVRAPGDGDDAAGTEVRIVAQRLADGRTEFALQQREADDEWGERLLPRARFFPATVTVGRWLVSTPLTVSLPELLLGTAADGGSVASDRAALVALYNATEGASWSTRTNWLSGRPLDEWHGVTTNSNGRVTELDLSSNDLHGALPAALGDLTNLESLRLSDNALTGQIPAALGDLTNLRALNLGSEGRGKLTGPIPAALGNLTNLESLDLSSNELTGSIPAWLGDLSNLRALNLSSNPLTGRIPAALGNLTNLESLWLGWNELTGPVPAWLGDLSNLVELGLSVNELTGPIPAELGDLSNLEGLDLSFNQLTGPIPAWLGDLTNLRFLDLGTNRLAGPIPAELGDLSNLVELWLLGNPLTGCVPVGLRDVAEDNDLGELGLRDCGLEGRATAIRVGANVRGALDYDGDIDHFRFQAEQGQSYRIDVAQGTLYDPKLDLFDSDGSFLDTNDDYGDTYASRLYWEAPSSGERYVAVKGGTGTYTLTVSLITDDHANSEGRATAIRVGADVRGAVGSQDDIDYFRFRALRGQIYQIDVALGTLDRSDLYLFDTDGSFLGNHLDDGGPFASGLYWEAPSSGERYVAVRGIFDIGTYILTVSLADPIDDHGNSGGRATEIRGVEEDGPDVRGALDYDGDIDYFRFRAAPERSYQINVALGTLDDSIVSLYGGDGLLLDTNDDYGDTLASRLFWEAPSSAERYVAVEGYGTGTYTLTVSIADDHGDDLGSATRIAIGEYVRTVLHDYDDRDVLVFGARPGTEYVLTLNYQTGERRGAAAGTTMALHDAGGRVLARLRDYDFSSNGSRNKIMWQAATGGDYYIVVGNEDAFGVFALTVTVR